MNDEAQWKRDARALFGERGWITALAEITGHKVRSAERWVSGQRPVPESLTDWLADTTERVPAGLYSPVGRLLRVTARMVRHEGMPAQDAIAAVEIVAQTLMKRRLP